MTDDMQEVLSSEYCVEEIKVVLFQIGPTKAPGPDEINALLPKIWDIVGDDMIAAVLNFLNSSNMLP